MKPKTTGSSEPKERSFGAFTQVEGNQATIDLEKLRKYNFLLSI